MPCKKEIHTSNRKLAAEVTASHKVPKTIYGCKVESHESTWQGVEPSLLENHEDHIAGMATGEGREQKKEVILEAQRDEKVHFATLRDKCHV